MGGAPQMGGMATQPLLFGGSQRQSVGHKISNGPQVAPHCLGAGDEIRNGPQLGGLAVSPLLHEWSPTPQCEG